MNYRSGTVDRIASWQIQQAPDRCSTFLLCEMMSWQQWKILSQSNLKWWSLGLFWRDHPNKKKKKKNGKMGSDMGSVPGPKTDSNTVVRTSVVVMLIAEDGLTSKSRCVSLLLEWCRVVCALYYLKVWISDSSLVLLLYNCSYWA